MPIDPNNPAPANPAQAVGGLGSALAQVVISDVLPNDQVVGYKSDASQDPDIPTDYRVRSRFEKDNRTYMMPLTRVGGTSRGRSASFVQLGSTTVLWVVEWTCARLKKLPDIPDSVPPSNWVLLDEYYETAAIVTGPDTTTGLYRISGTYVFGATDGPGFGMSDVRFPIVSWLQSNKFTRNAGSIVKLQGII